MRRLRGPALRLAAALPALIAAALVIATLRVVMILRSDRGFPPPVPGRDIPALVLAEAGIEQAIADIGRQALALEPGTDTLAYEDRVLGVGTFTTRIRTLGDGTVEMTSTGRVAGGARSIRASLEVIRVPAWLARPIPGRGAWAIRGKPSALYRHSLDEKEQGRAWIHPEGAVTLPGEDLGRIRALAAAPGGDLYFIPERPGKGDLLYRIQAADIDGNPATAIQARLVGPVGLPASEDESLRGLAFFGADTGARSGVLYALAWKTGKVYELSLEHGAASYVSDLAPRGLAPGEAFWCEGLAQDSAGNAYTVRDNGHSELWRFEIFVTAPGRVKDTLSRVTRIAGAKDRIRALAGHPDGMLYAAGPRYWYRIDPADRERQGRVRALFTDGPGLTAMTFDYERELERISGRPVPPKSRICHHPPGNCGNSHVILADRRSLKSHLRHSQGGPCEKDLPGSCGGSRHAIGEALLGRRPAAGDTALRLRLLSWEELPWVARDGRP